MGSLSAQIVAIILPQFYLQFNVVEDVGEKGEGEFEGEGGVAR